MPAYRAEPAAAVASDCCEQTLGLIPALQLAHNQKTAPTSRLTRAPHRSPFVAIARTAGALTNPLEHKLECSYGDFRAAAGGRFVDGSLQHREDNWDVGELHIGANEAGGLGGFEWVGKQLQYSVPQVPQVTLAVRGTAQYAQQPWRARLFQNELLEQLAEQTRTTRMQVGQFVKLVQTLLVDSQGEQPAFREVPVERGLPHARATGDAIQRYVCAITGEQLRKSRKYRLAIALGIASSACG